MIRLLLFILTRRYRLTIKGRELLERTDPTLFLQNHQSHIDPQIIGVVIKGYREIVPVISEKYMRMPIIGSILKSWNSIPVSDLKHGNRDPKVLSKIYSGVTASFKAGRSVLIAPSGQIALSAVEKINNKQTAHVLVSDLPEKVKVVGIRISGLWGSMWSVGWRGGKPNFLFTLTKAVFYLSANFIFFLPKRPVMIECIDITEEAKLKSKLTRKEFNTYLEEFYNQNETEKVTHIKHFFYLPNLRKEPKN